MKRILIVIITLAISFTACNLLRSEIDGEKVNVDDRTKVYTFKEDGKKVTGTVVLYEFDPKTRKKYRHKLCEVRDGIRVNKGYDYYPSGKVNVEFTYDSNGMVAGTVKYYYENGKISATKDFKDDKENGSAKEYSEKGIQTKEIIYEAGNKIREYDFDESGNKIIPAIDKLELVDIITGFYVHSDMFGIKTLFQPIVIMKWKNATSQAMNEKVKIEGLFISKGEEWSKESSYFQWSHDPPLQAGLARQISLQSSVGYQHPDGVYKSDISCQILINNQLYKTVQIKQDLITSDRIQ